MAGIYAQPTYKMQHEDQHIIHQNEFGSISICTHCQQVCLDLGNIRALTCKNSLTHLKEDMLQRQENIKEILVDTPSGPKCMIPVTKTICMSLNVAEFKQLVELLEISCHMLQVKDIIEA